MNQELYGAPTNLPWGIQIPRDARVAPYESLIDYPLDTLFHPIWAYEALWSLVAFYVLCGAFTISTAIAWSAAIFCCSTSRNTPLAASCWNSCALRVAQIGSDRHQQLADESLLIAFVVSAGLLLHAPSRSAVESARPKPTDEQPEADAWLTRSTIGPDARQHTATGASSCAVSQAQLELRRATRRIALGAMASRIRRDLVLTCHITLFWISLYYGIVSMSEATGLGTLNSVYTCRLRADQRRKYGARHNSGYRRCSQQRRT